MTLLLGLAVPLILTADPLAAAPSADDPAASGARRTGAVMMAVGAIAAAYGAWTWSTNDAQVAWLDPVDVERPSMHWTAEDAPAVSLLASSMGGLQWVSGTAGRRGSEQSLPWHYWLGLIPAGAAVGTELVALDRGGVPTRAQELTVAIGMATSAAWFLASALWEGAHPAPRPGGSEAIGRETGRPLFVLPTVMRGREGAVPGFAMSGGF